MNWNVTKNEVSLRACKNCGYPDPLLYDMAYEIREGTAYKYKVICMCGVTTGEQNTEKSAINFWNGIQLDLIDPIVNMGSTNPNYDVVCYKCGKKDVQTMYWVDSNNRSVKDMIGAYNDEEAHYCNNCKEHVRLVYETKYRSEA